MKIDKTYYSLAVIAVAGICLRITSCVHDPGVHPAMILTIIFLVLCYYDSEEILYPNCNTACDTLNVTFNGSIIPILNSNCRGCHSNSSTASAGNNIKLENYSDVTAQINTILPAIKHIGALSPMPKSGGKLSDCSIARFDIWVRNGMLNN